MSAAPLRVEGLGFRRPGAESFVMRLEHLEVGAGEVVAMVGPSGSGKSTLLQLISGELVPQTGSVHVGGVRMDTLPDAERRAVRRRRIGVVAQTLSLIEYLSGIENVLLVSIMEGGARASRDRARELARSLDVEHVLSRRPHRMSQGERQRIAICRALLLRPPVLLCDEPTGNLDADRGERAVRLMLDAARSDQAAVLIATHDERLIPLVDRVVSLEAELADGAPS